MFVKRPEKRILLIELARDYRTVFSGSSGERVLVDILSDLGFFNEDVETPVEQAGQNYARGILRKLGIWDAANSIEIVRRLMEIPIFEGKEGENDSSSD